MPMYGGGDGDGDRWGGAVTPGGSLNEQIVVALARLQEDMQSVLERLHTLEALTASQVRPVGPERKNVPKKMHIHCSAFSNISGFVRLI